MTTLFGQTAIISGGLGDIGSAIALEFAKQGADVAVGDVLAEKHSYKLSAEIEQLGRHFHYMQVDVSDSDAVENWVDRVDKALTIPSLIIPNAAIVTLSDIRHITPSEWSRELRINLDGAFFLAQSAAKRLIEREHPGRIVFVGSWAAHAPHSHIPAYCTSKAGLRMLCKCMALELARYNILVNEIAPGYVDAGLTGKIFDENPGSRETSQKRVPVNSLITAAEVAQQAAHLCQPDNRHMTGSTLLMDGGLSLLTSGMQFNGE